MALQSDGASELMSLPFAPGESPFRVKGTAYRGHLEYTAQHVPGGVAGMIEDFTDPRLRKFFEQPFLAASLYDVFPLAIAGVVCAKRTKQRYLDFVRVRSKAQAQTDLGGVYRVLLALASPEAVAARIPRLVGQYFDFVESTIVQKGRGKVVGTWSGLPVPIAPWYVCVSSTYGPVVIGHAGGTEPRFDTLKTTPDGTRAGIELVKIDFQITWR